MKKISLITLALMLLSCALAAEMSDTVISAAKKLGYNIDDGRQYFGTSEVWSYDESKEVAALAVPSKAACKAGTCYDTVLVFVDSISGRVLARETRKDTAAPGNALLRGISVSIEEIEPAKGVKTVEVIRIYEGPSTTEIYGVNVLDMYVLSGGKLRRVISDRVVFESKGTFDGKCEARLSDISRSLSMADTKSKGYYGIKVDGTFLEKANILSAGGDCKQELKDTPDPKIYKLKYDGKKYPVPVELRLK